MPEFRYIVTVVAEDQESADTIMSDLEERGIEVVIANWFRNPISEDSP